MTPTTGRLPRARATRSGRSVRVLGALALAASTAVLAAHPALAAGAADPTGSPAPTRTATTGPTATPVPSESPLPSSGPNPTDSPTADPTPTDSPSPTPSPTPPPRPGPIPDPPRGHHPIAPVAAPAVVEGPTPYIGQNTCDPSIKPGAAAFLNLVMSSYGAGRNLGITRACAIGDQSEHKEGRGIDWGLLVSNPTEKATGDAYATWVTAVGPDGKVGYQARRLGIMYFIWNRRIWSASNPNNGGWAAYGGPNAHIDHIHTSLSWNGAYQRTSFWTGQVSPTDYGSCIQVAGQARLPHGSTPQTTPCPRPLDPGSLTASPALHQGDTGPYVVLLQLKLRNLVPDGVFGAGTAARLRAFQQSAGLPATGDVDEGTWQALRPSAQSSPPTPVPIPSVLPAPGSRAHRHWFGLPIG